MKTNELRKKSIAELKKEYVELLQEQFNLRMQKVSSQLKQTHQFKKIRRALARVLTIITEKTGNRA